MKPEQSVLIAEVFPIGEIQLDDCRYDIKNFFGWFTSYKESEWIPYLQALLLALKDGEVIKNNNGCLLVDTNKINENFLDELVKRAGLKYKTTIGKPKILEYLNELISEIIDTGYTKEAINKGELTHTNDATRNRQSRMWSFTEEIK